MSSLDPIQSQKGAIKSNRPSGSRIVDSGETERGNVSCQEVVIRPTAQGFWGNYEGHNNREELGGTLLNRIG
jgi:hypothetical protein